MIGPHDRGSVWVLVEDARRDWWRGFRAGAVAALALLVVAALLWTTVLR